jgi:hypothetical protein
MWACDRAGIPIRLAGLVMLALLSGCSSLDLRERPWLLGCGRKPLAPQRMVDMWTDALLHQPGMPAVRGFGGRILFYAEDENPVAVEGTFTVFAFDETDGEPSYSTPTKEFVFLPKHLSEHYSKSELGHSYSFWLPWDEVGGLQRKVCLIARFEPSQGPPIISKPSHQTLPGELPKSARPGESAQGLVNPPGPPMGNAVQPASHEEAATEPVRREPTEMITIDVPPSFARPGAVLADQQPVLGMGLENTRPPARTAEREQPPPSDPPAESSPSTRLGLRRFPAPRGPMAQSHRDPVRRQPLPGMWPSALPATPRSDWSGTAQAITSNDTSAPD